MTGGDHIIDFDKAKTSGDPDMPAFMMREPSTEILPPLGREIVMPGRRLDEIAAELRQIHGVVQDGLRQTLPKAIRAGELLVEAKAKVDRGKWLSWVDEHCGFSEDTAQLYMKLFKHRAQIAAVLNTEPVRYLTFKDALNAIPKPQKKASPSKPAAEPSEKRVTAALRAMHDCEPAERRRVIDDPGIRESVETKPQTIPLDIEEAQVESGPDFAWNTLLAAWNAADAETRARFVIEKAAEIATARPKGKGGWPKGRKRGPRTTKSTNT